jgi:hypothetical protein
MAYETIAPASHLGGHSESLRVVRRYMNDFFGFATTHHQIDLYVNYGVRINFRDQEMHIMFKLGHG